MYHMYVCVCVLSLVSLGVHRPNINEIPYSGEGMVPTGCVKLTLKQNSPGPTQQGSVYDTRAAASRKQHAIDAC